MARWAGLFWAGVALVFCAGAAQAQGEAALMKRASELREAPGESARSLAALPEQAPVVRLGERQGPWIQVRSGQGVTGWVHMFDVAPAAGAAAGTSASASGNTATGALRSVTNFFNKGGSQRPATTATSTIGIRGLGAQDLAQAQPNPGAVVQMEALRQSEGQAREFASDAALAGVNVPALPVPSRASTPGAATGNPGQMP